MEIDFCLSCKKCTVCETNAYVRETLILISDKFFLRNTSYCTSYCQRSIIFRGRSRDFGKGGSLYVGHHGCWMKKILGFRWSKKAKITLETISFWQSISISIFKFSPFLYTMKTCRWNLINFSKFANALIRKEKKHLCSSQWEKKNWEKLDFVL